MRIATIKALAYSCMLLASLQLFGITRTARASGYGEREAALTDDPNTTGSVLALGVVSMIAFAYGRKTRAGGRGLLALGGLPILAVAIVRTGSRGALLALAIGLLVVVLRKGNISTRFRNAAVVLGALAVLFYISLSVETSAKRWHATLESGSMAGRERIYPAAWKMFEERPIAGWGPIKNHLVLGDRLGHPSKDTHNLYLWLLTEVGLLGFVPYAVGLVITIRAAWKARSGTEGVLPLALLATLLVINMSLTWQNRKLYWLFLGFAIASAQPIQRRPAVPAKPLWHPDRAQPDTRLVMARR